MAVVMAVHGRPTAPFDAIVGRIAVDANVGAPEDTVLTCSGDLPKGDLSAFAALLVTPQVSIASAPQARIVVCERLD